MLYVNSTDFCRFNFCPGKSFENVIAMQSQRTKTFFKLAYASTETNRVYLVYAYGKWAIIPYTFCDNIWSALPTSEVRIIGVTEQDLASEALLKSCLINALSTQFVHAEEGYSKELPKMKMVLAMLRKSPSLDTLRSAHINFVTISDVKRESIVYCSDGDIKLISDLSGIVDMKHIKRKNVSIMELIGDFICDSVSFIALLPGMLFDKLHGRE